MKTYILLSLASLAARHVAAGPHPLLQWDPATAKDCAGWYDNVQEMPCEEVRNLFSITPEQLHEWNPSVGLDCTPWNYQSYCIFTLKRLETDPPPAVSASTTAVATTATGGGSSSTLAPSPTAWAARGCYVEDARLPLLDENVSGPGGDATLTIGKCKDSCYHRAYPFAGVQEGNQCWCGTYVGGEWARNQSDCSIPCSGDKTTFCGGNGLLNIFQALENSAVFTMPVTVSGAPSVSGPFSVSGTSMSTSTASSGATRNIAMFWL
ncbi:hypothetical protein N657DRAFT_650837 [Parathielavia appendiculata]|uniref:WSC domain-containing protein n=1 Tax=Parathielavia appendiculata TaxID=2587402 RepID=A0AAN6YYH2_9PEZI|nr:hypothetical protein N657DRAFT_650837 [Parathielavia appendiculata]